MHKSVSRKTTFFLLAMLFVCFYGVAQDHPNLQRGYAPGKTMGLEGPDDINLYNGNLSLKVPLGQSYPITESFSYSFALRYNSNVWDFVSQRDPDPDCEDDQEGCQAFTSAFPTGFSNAGLGWTLSLGQILPRQGQFGQYNPSNRWVYVSPDGGKHAFYWKLHIDDPDLDPISAWYTRDGSYLRLIFTGTAASGRNSLSVETPDGMLHTFEDFVDDQYVDASPTTWRLVEIRDPFENYLKISYVFSCPYDGACEEKWTVTDSTSFLRKHVIVFRDQGSGGMRAALVEGSDRELDELRLASAHGGTACYKFQYLEHTIPRSGKCDDAYLSDQTNIRVLDEIVFPDSHLTDLCTPSICTDCSTAEFDYNVDSLDYLGFQCDNVQTHLSDLPGTLAQMRLPTGGLISWDYEDYEFPVGEMFCSDPGPHPSWFTAIRGSLGVQTRTRAGSLLSDGIWTYNHEDPTSSTDTDVSTEVIAPEPHHKTKYFFNTDIVRCPTTWSGWDYGLPYTRESAVDNGELFLAREYYENSGSNSYSLKRSTYVRYEHDALPPDSVPYGDTSPPDEWYNTNRRLAETKTVVFGDIFSLGFAFEHAKYSRFDGLGHYREIEKKTSFDPADDEYRVSFTGFYKLEDWFSTYYPEYYIDENNSGASDTYVPWDPLAENPWILNTFDQKTSTDSGGTQISEFCFDQSTGFLEGSRLRKSSSSRDENDIVTKYIPDTQGDVKEQQLFGADKQDIYASGPPFSACDPGSSQSPQFELFHEYSYGVRNRSYHVVTTGAGPRQLNIIDRTIDLNTGLTTVERDSSGYPTEFTYDKLGRAVLVDPHDGARTSIEFQPALGVAPAKVTVTAEDREETPAVLSQADYTFSAFGNLEKERHLLADGTWNQRLYGTNANGWQTFVSEWQADGVSSALAEKTSFTDFDIFGRPWTTTLPDDSQILDAYTGERVHNRTSSINIGENEEDTETKWEYDALGRLRVVSEPSGENGAMVSTVYSYDVGNRLTQVNTGDGAGAQQRIFGYDLLGFLRYSDIPERIHGIGQNFDVSYGDYDAMGNAGLVVDGDNSLKSVFDEAGRLTEIRDSVTQDPLKELKYCPGDPALTDACAGWSAGKLGQTLRHNYFEPLEITSDFIVSQDYNFEGIGGAVSRLVTKAGIAGGVPKVFETEYGWTDLGDLLDLEYPTLGGRVNGRLFEMTYAYTNGWLTQILENTGRVWTEISYQPNGLVQTMEHINDVTDHHTPDPDAMIRPRLLSTSGAIGGDWTSGTYTYDGSGNIAAIGNQDYFYDKVQRLTGHRIIDGTVGTSWEYFYDQFGNFLAKSFAAWDQNGGSAVATDNPTDSATNRLLYQSYDAAGNQTSRNSAMISYTHFNEIYETNSNGRIRTFGYDFGGERIIVRDNQLANGSVGKVYSIRGLDGKVLREFQEDDASGLTWTKDYVYRGSKLLASVTPEGTRHFHLDHLGTPRLITDEGGNRVAYHEYLPFGMEMSNPYEDTEKMKFTGHERDFLNQPGTNFDLDYMHARHYSPAKHRFLSLDLAGADLSRPQTWNLYTYVLNNPVKYMDPFGLEGAIPCDNDGADNGLNCFCEEIRVTDESTSSQKIGYFDAPAFWISEKGRPDPWQRILTRNQMNPNYWKAIANIPVPPGHPSPDYYAFTVGLGLPPNPVTILPIGVHASLQLNKDGTIYVGGGPDVGRSLMGYSISAVEGHFDSPSGAPLAADLSLSWGAGALFGSNRVKNAFSPKATEFGIFNPQIGASGTIYYRIR